MKVSVSVALEIADVEAIDQMAGKGNRSAWIQGAVARGLAGAQTGRFDPRSPEAKERAGVVVADSQPRDAVARQVVPGVPGVTTARALVRDGDFQREPVDDGPQAW